MKLNMYKWHVILILFIIPVTFVFSEPIIIGLDADMSAVAVDGGIAIKRGAQLAIDDINQAGGVLGRKLTLEVRDHRGNPARGVKNIEYFAQKENVIAVMGGVHTPVALHELPVIHQNEMIYLGPWAAGTSIVDNGYKPNYVFRLSVRDEHAGYVLMNYVHKRSYKNVGLLLERTGWGRSNEKSMRLAAKKLGLSILAVEWFNWREKHMSDQLERLYASGVEVVLLVSNAPEGASIIKEMAKWNKEKRLPIVSHWGIAGGAFFKKVGLEAMQKVDVSVLQTYSFLLPRNKKKMEKLLKSYREKFDPEVTAESMPAAVGVVHSYDLIHLLGKAIKKANSIDRKKVRSALESLEYYDGVFKYFDSPFSPDRHDALGIDDYIMTKYNSRGNLVPIQQY